ncbi:MAG: class I SAM-dependent methyltransferase [Bacteroidetes bacterium]|nr:class I SAM-dependent methyltransferase [Bacteroidota bacterium]
MNLIQKKILRLGYNLVRLSKPYKKNNLTYSRVLPLAIYSPWYDDKIFQDTYKKIATKYTLVDEFRCFELWKLIEQTNKLDETAAVLEVGVWRGGTSVIMATKLKLLNSSSVVYAADTFEGVVKTSEKDASYRGGEHADTSLDLFFNLYTSLGLKNINTLKGIFPEQTASQVPTDTKFKLCHIDVDVYLSAKDVQDWIWDKLIIGGMILFDDYGFSSTNGITNFVNEQMLLNDRVILHNLNGHAVIIKIK